MSGAGVCHSAGKFYLHDGDICVSDICIDDRLRKTELDLDLFSAIRLSTYWIFNFDFLWMFRG